MPDTTYTLDPIGRVAVGTEGFSLVIDEAFREALTGLEGFSHLYVLFWCHHLDTPEAREVVVAEKPYREGPDRVGIFATRSPARPNPIALTAVQVLGIDHRTGVVQVGFIDAEPDTPVLDLKAYYPFDRVRDVSVPAWCAGWPAWAEEAGEFDWGAVFENAQ